MRDARCGMDKERRNNMAPDLMAYPNGSPVHRDVVEGVIDLGLSGVSLRIEDGKVLVSGRTLTADERGWLKARRWHVLDLLVRTEA